MNWLRICLGILSDFLKTWTLPMVLYQTCCLLVGLIVKMGCGDRQHVQILPLCFTRDASYKLAPKGQALWHSGFWHCLTPASLLSQLPAPEPKKAAGDSHTAGFLPPMWNIGYSSRLLALYWSSSGACRQFKSEPAGGRTLSFCISFSIILPFK